MSGTQSTKWAKLLDAWKRLQISYYGGKYSIHRLLALENYTRRATLTRALLVCIGTPLPMAALVFRLESLPLRDPKEGWRANYGFWIRLAVMTFMIAHVSTGQAVYFIDNFQISTRQLIKLCCGVSIVFTACAIVISANVIFPLPFLVLVLTPIYNVIHVILFRVILGIRMLRQLLAQRGQLVQYMNLLHAQIMMMFMYPAYEVLFRFVQGSRFQLPVILLLPVMKVIIKNIVLRCTKHVEDMTPELVIFTVDFFNAIYVATCMQSATSVSAVVAIIVTDLSQTVIMLYGLYRRTNGILSRLRASPLAVQESDNLLTALCSLCRNTDIFGKQARAGINTFSSFPVRLSTEDAIFLKTLDAAAKRTGPKSIALLMPPTISNAPLPHGNTKKAKFCCACTKIHPSSPDLNEGTQPTERPQRFNYTISEQPTLLQNSLEALFTLECLVVTAYLEAVVPFFYTTYILVMVHFPSAQYHSEMSGVSRENVGSTVFPVFVFGLLQVASFWMLVAVVTRNCGMRALYQLAFVLESHMWSIQSKLMVWMMITLCFRLVHFGVDFTFKFSRLGW